MKIHKPLINIATQVKKIKYILRRWIASGLFSQDISVYILTSIS